MELKMHNSKMKKATKGQTTQKGFNVQNWAGMALFLQFVMREDFRYVVFEGKESQDFILTFEDGRKIACEVKNFEVELHDIREILEKAIERGWISEKDELLIICPKVNERAKSLIENYKYFEKGIEKILTNKRHKFTKTHLRLLPQLKFWEIQDRQTVEKLTYFLMLRVLNYKRPFWISPEKLKEITKAVVQEKVYFGSEVGDTLTRDDFFQLIENIKIRILEDDGTNYEKLRKVEEDEIKKIIKLVRSRSPELDIRNEITKLYASPYKFHFTLQLLQEEKNLELSRWENLWIAAYQSAFVPELFKIFENNIKTKENQKFIIQFILDNFNLPINFWREEFIKYDIVKICQKILDKNLSLTEEIFEIIKRLYGYSINRFLYTGKGKDDSWEREKIAKLLKTLYQKTKKRELKQRIISYIIESFNLVEDGGKYWHYTPPAIFDILKEYVIKNPEKLISWFIKICVRQYQNFYKRFGVKFNGWEHMGSGISWWGSEFSVSDKYFVEKVLTPAFEKLDKRGKFWQTVGRYVVRDSDSEEISPEKPDFVNRAIIPILLEKYRKARGYKKETLDILTCFIKMRKGIPWKNDLIFQKLAKDRECSDKQKWQLVKISLDEYKNLPVNVFVKQIVAGLAAKGHKEALNTIESWAKNEEYYRTRSWGDLDIPDLVSRLLENSPDSVQFKELRKKGVLILKTYFNSSYFKNKKDIFDVYDDAEILAKLLRKDFDNGLRILEDAYKPQKPTTNQQVLICSSIYKISDQESDLLKIYEKFVKPKLEELLKQKVGDLGNLEYLTDKEYKETIEEKFTDRHAREYLVQFAEKLAKAKCFEEALWLVRIFIHDSDPPKDGRNYDDDSNGEFNEHKRIEGGEDQLAIRTVRGWCAWVLDKFNRLEGRDYIGKIIPLVEKLANDPNHYVRLQAIVPLMGLVRVRHTHMPGNKKERFIPLGLAEKIENLAFKMLKDKKNWSLFAIMKRLAMLFSYMRGLTTVKAQEALKIFLEKTSFPGDKDKKDRSRELLLGKKTKLYDEVIKEIMALLIYYAEFRKKHFREKKFKYIYKDKWEKIRNFDSKWFVEKLEELVKKGSSAVRTALAWHFWRLPQEPKAPFEEVFEVAIKYLELLTNKYDHKVFKNIYHFIEDNIDKKPKRCLKLWKECVKKESAYFKQGWSETELHEMSWWPFFYNGKILVSILKNKNKKEFLEWFKKLAEYPSKVLIANDLDVAVEKLVNITDKKYYNEVNNLFNLLMRRNLKYYDFKQKWLERINNG